MYLCADINVIDNTCDLWVPFVGLLPPLSVADALTISAGAFTVWGIAWGVRRLVRQIIN